MNVALSPGLVRRSLAGHSWIGVLVGAAMYLVCLSGTLLVFHDALVRWEQPDVVESTEWTPAAVQRGFDAAFGDAERITPHLYAILPTAELPRLRYASETWSAYADPAGRIGAEERNAFTDMLVSLHYYLHLPHAWGIVLVSALGAMLVALIISGLLAHPSLFRDAFRWRRHGDRRLAATDLHNRLGVWATPFHLMIGVTGTYFGFALLLGALWAGLFADGDREAVVEGLFGGDPVLEQPGRALAIDRALIDVRARAPDETPFLVVVHDADTPARHISVSTRVPGRLVYAEEYLYDAAGVFLQRRGLQDEDPGRAVVYSLYRLHFGSFAGIGVQALYGVLGLALTVIAASGGTIWLARRRTRTWLNPLWVAIVWGAPIAIATAGIAYVAIDVSPTGVFWGAYMVAAVGAPSLGDEARSRRVLRNGAALALALLAGGHLARYGLHGGAIAVVNGLLVCGAVGIAALGRDHHTPTREVLPDERLIAKS